MKRLFHLPLTFALAAVTFGAFAPPAEAKPAKAKRYTMAEICGDDEMCRTMVREMLKRPASRKIMAKEAAKDPGFRQSWQEESASLGRGG